MSEQPLGLRERNRIRTRETILDSMATLLAEQAFENITIDEVSRHAGVSRGTIYSYFPDGRDQLLRDAYIRVADLVATEGAARRAEQTGFTDRIVALATVFSSAVAKPEGRFYGLNGRGGLGPLAGVAGTGSTRFGAMIEEDLAEARQQGLFAASTAAEVEGLGTVLAGAVREIGFVTAMDPERAPGLLAALRVTCDALIAQHP